MRSGIDYIGVSAGAVIRNSDGAYFLAKRSCGARDDRGLWEFPGGSVALFETREQAACRNILDKYGMSIEVVDTLDVYDVIDKENGDHWVSTTYLCTHVSGEPKVLVPQKCEQIGWFTLDEVRKLPLSRITQRNLLSLANREKM